MFAIESWPETIRHRRDNPGLHVVASPDPSILLEMGRPELDMLVWARRVPEQWPKDMTRFDSLPEPIRLEGSMDHVLAHLAKSRLRRGWPAFVIEDVAQTVALGAALFMPRTLHVRLDMLSKRDSDIEGTAGRWRIVGCYGAGSLRWMSGQISGETLDGQIDPFGLAFVRMSGDGEAHLRFARHGAPCIGLSIDIL